MIDETIFMSLLVVRPESGELGAVRVKLYLESLLAKSVSGSASATKA